MKVETPAEQLFFVTVPLWATGSNGDSWSGTGFLVAVPIQSDDDRPKEMAVLVSNAHVVQGATQVAGGFHSASIDREWRPGKGNRIDLGGYVKYPWTVHPDPEVDVAVLPVGPVLSGRDGDGNGTFFRTIGLDIFFDPSGSLEPDALEDVVFVGYPNGLSDPASNLPILRRGVTATPIAIDYDSKPVFLIDASVFPGSSGSPVFLFNRGMYPVRGVGTAVGTRLVLLGVLAAVHVRQVIGEMIDLPTQSAPMIDEPVDLGVVFRADAIKQAIDHMISTHGLPKRADHKPDPRRGEDKATEVE